ncbi:MAG: universal stress protein [Emticicia sp.]|uniref:universal stress protein n=1 Tax=Emticicia sp. TaxID=1930953 RepID=UPI003BA44D67
MKVIVFATDFSRGSRKAAQTAAQTAAKTGAKLILFHAYRFLMPYDSEMSSLALTADELEKHSLNLLKRLKNRLIKKFSTTLEVELMVKEGLVIDALAEVLQETKADLLVMGSVGESPLASKFFGSLATSMVHHSNVPMLLVPPKVKYSSFQNAVLGLDFRYEIDVKLLGKTINILRDLDAVVNLYTVTDESDYAKDSALKIRELMKNVPHTSTIMEGEDFPRAVIDFARVNHSDLIITFPRKHNIFERFFIETNTERLVKNDDISILTVV